MAKLTTLRPRLRALDTRRVKPFNGTQLRISGSVRVSLKRKVYERDGGRCCMCKQAVDLHDSQLDHRIALQFGGSNEECNLWTLCVDCHARKSAREAASRQPDNEALEHSISPTPPPCVL